MNLRTAKEGDAPVQIAAQGLTAEQRQQVMSVRYLVEKIVTEEAPGVYGAAREDLINEGWLGAIKAALLHNEELGTRYSTFAAMHIKYAIIDAIRKEARHVRIKRAASHATRTYVAEEPDTFNVIWDKEATRRANYQTFANRMVAAMAAGMAAQTEMDPEELAAHRQARERMAKCVKQVLDEAIEPECKVYRLRYEKKMDEDVMLTQIAEKLGVAEITVRRWHESLLDKIYVQLHAAEITGWADV